MLAITAIAGIHHPAAPTDAETSVVAGFGKQTRCAVLDVLLQVTTVLLHIQRCIVQRRTIAL